MKAMKAAVNNKLVLTFQAKNNNKSKLMGTKKAPDISVPNKARNIDKGTLIAIIEEAGESVVFCKNTK